MRFPGVFFAWTAGLAILLAVFPGLPGLTGTAYAATPTPPVIVGLKVTHSRTTLPAHGLRVKLTVRVRNATRCTFLRQTKPRTPLKRFRRVSCASGGAAVTIPAIRNPYRRTVRLTFAVTVQGPGGTAHREVRLAEAAAPTPQPTASLTLSPQVLASAGGDVTLAYSSKHAKSCSLSASSDLWPGSNPLTVSCNGSTKVTGIPSTVAQAQWTVTFTAKGPGGKATASKTLTQQGSQYSPSSNWSGYVLTSASAIAGVSGRFTVPTLDCAETPDAGESTWVGIGGSTLPDGSSSGDLLQTGVESDCSGGVQIDSPAWWEEYPETPEIAFSSMSVSPGDAIEAAVYKASNGSWVTRLDDLTTGVSGLMITGDAWGTVLDSDPSSWDVVEGNASSIGYAGGFTAEWIVEDYAAGSGGHYSLVPLADYGTLTFSNLTTSVPSWSLAAAEAVAIVHGGSALSVPSVPSATGFSVTYTG